MTLSAKKEDIQVAPCSVQGDLPTFDSFGKVVNSIQGLQQRLENFTAADVGEAHDKTQTLASGLLEIQRKLERFAEIKQSMAAVQASVEAALTDCAGLAKVDSIEETPRMEWPLQTSNLIPFPRVNKVTPVADVSDDVDAPGAIQAAVVFDPPEPLETEEETTQAVAVQAPETDVPSGAIPQPAPTGEMMDQTGIEQEHDDGWSLGEADASLLLRVDPFVASRDTGSGEAIEQPQIPVDDWERSVASPAITESRPSIASSETFANEGEDTITVPATPNVDFDQRLLDDLIKNYGEFTASLQSSRPARPVDVPDQPSPQAVETEAPAAVQTIEPEPQTRNLPTTTKDGDLDRQLKKIIKDYGEYDLYSRQSPMNIKTGVIAAFLLLGLIFSGFYFFSPKAASSPNAASETPDVGTASGRTSAPAGIHERENSAKRPAAAIAEGTPARASETHSRTKDNP